MLGSVLLVLGLVIGASLADVLAGFPLPILVAMLAVSGALHIALLKDLQDPYHWALAIAVGVTGFVTNLAIAVAGAMLIWWAGKAVTDLRHRSHT
jgi:sulfate permease, SulP family